MDGWMDGWMDGKAVLRFAVRCKKLWTFLFYVFTWWSPEAAWWVAPKLFWFAAATGATDKTGNSCIGFGWCPPLLLLLEFWKQEKQDLLTPVSRLPKSDGHPNTRYSNIILKCNFLNNVPVIFRCRLPLLTNRFNRNNVDDTRLCSEYLFNCGISPW